MDDLLWPRVLAAFGVDVSLAVLCGLLLSGLWLGDVSASLGDLRGRSTARLLGFSALLLVALGVQLLLLAASFCGQTSVRAVMASMPDVCSTHAGTLLLALVGVTVLLCLATLIPSPRPYTPICGLLVAIALCLHAMTGHAAGDGNFSPGVLLQSIHLLGMAIWSGGVMVSGLAIVPRLQRQALGETALAHPSLTATYLDRLSIASTWAVGAVILSGFVKAWIATGASLQVVRSSQWGQVLTIKTAFVMVTVLLGARNRWLLTSNRRQGSLDIRRIGRTLRLEAISMLAVLLISAWLANSSPPLE